MKWRVLAALALALAMAACTTATKADILVPEVGFSTTDEARLRNQIELLRKTLDDATNSSGRFSVSAFWVEDVMRDYARVESAVSRIRESEYFSTSALRRDWESAAAKKAQLDGCIQELDRQWRDHQASVAALRDAVDQYEARAVEMLRKNLEPALVGPYKVSVTQCRYDLEVLDFASRPYALGDPRPRELGRVARGDNLFLEPRLQLSPGFIVDVAVENTSTTQLLRPGLFQADSYVTTGPDGAIVERFIRLYRFTVSDDLGNELRFHNEPSSTSREGRRAIRPGDTLVVDLRFNQDNAPVIGAGAVVIRFDEDVFGSSLALRVPRDVYSSEALVGNPPGLEAVQR